jgi:putative ABC transport system permease protein
MRALDRKLLRDLWRLKWQMSAIALLIACGVAVAEMAWSAREALQTARNDYYARTAFADVFATAKRAPLSLVRGLSAIDGVTAVDARAVKTGLMPVPGLLRPAMATLISLPDEPRRALNQLVLVQGRLPDPARTDEAVALKTFAEAARIPLGGTVHLVIDGRSLTLRIVGLALSPEYVYVPAVASPMPDDAHQGVLWAPRAMVERAAGLGGAFSAVSLKLAPGASVEPVLAAVDRVLAPYGGQPAIGRHDQASDRFQTDHIQQMGLMAMVIPPIFLAVAAALVGMVLGRMVEAEREQIGLLKAFGYSDLAAASGYLRMAALVGLIGAAAGGALGGWMGGLVIDLMARYVRSPSLHGQFSWVALALSAGVSMAAAVGGSVLAVRRALRLSPAVAMQPPAPAAYRRGLLEGAWFWAWFDQPTRMIVRSLERYPLRAALTGLGLAASLSLLVGSQFMFGSLDEIVNQAYYRARHWSDAVGFGEPRDIRALSDVRRMPGVIAAEPVRDVAVRVHARGHEEKVLLAGLEPEGRLAGPLDRANRRLPLEKPGVILSRVLAGRLQVAAGDRIEVETLGGRRIRAATTVSAVAEDYSGPAAYMARGALNRLLGEGDLASAAQLQVAPDLRPAFYAAIERTPSIIGAASRDDTVAQWRSTVASTVSIEMGFYLAFAGAIAFGIAYNVSRIALSDRARDLATLRVLGFGQGECAYILLGELAFLALAATPLGALGGYGIAQALVAAFSHEDMQLPPVVSLSALGGAVAVYLLAVLGAGALVAQRIWSFDLVSVLKTRE